MTADSTASPSLFSRQMLICVFTGFASGLPLYLQIRLGHCVLHLSGHHGDATPGGHVRVPCTGLREFQQALLAKRYGHARPGIETQLWGLDMTVSDPFGNRLTFTQALEAA